VWDIVLQGLADSGGELDALQMIDSTTSRAHRCAAGEKATVLSVKRRFAFLWSGMDRVASRLALRAPAFGGFGLDPPRSMPAGVFIGSTLSFTRIAMGSLSG
jgi:hypothetical protein